MAFYVGGAVFGLCERLSVGRRRRLSAGHEPVIDMANGTINVALGSEVRLPSLRQRTLGIERFERSSLVVLSGGNALVA